MKMIKLKYTIAFSLAILLFACGKKESVINYETPSIGAYSYELNNAPHFVSNFMVTDAKAQLGRALFYDKSLSINGRTSCGSCHDQKIGFTDGLPLSKGFINQTTPLHSMTLVNIGANNVFFWDGRANQLKQQVLMPISNHIEMGIDDAKLLVAKVEGSPMYRDLFSATFQDGEISTENIGDALANFVASIVSYNTKFDRVNNGQEIFTPLEKKGKELFNTKYNCSSCHGGDNFNSSWSSRVEFANIGLDREADMNTVSNGTFKVPSLRNIEVTGPYMHDGRFETLDKVLDHYSQGMKTNQAMDWRLLGFASNGGMRISADEKKAIIAFLKTLTDHQMLNDPKFSNPF